MCMFEFIFIMLSAYITMQPKYSARATDDPDNDMYVDVSNNIVHRNIVHSS